MSSELSYPVLPRFTDAIKRAGTIVFTEEIVLHGQILKQGSIVNILGWREIDSIAYIVISKGSWTALVKFEDIKSKFDDCI